MTPAVALVGDDASTAVAADPTQLAAGGVRYDFNDGARVALPNGRWRVRLTDLETSNVLFQTEMGQGRVNSSKRYFVRFRIEVWDLSAAGETRILIHDYEARGRHVLVQFHVGTLGDTIAWMPAAIAFADRHRCRLTCAMSALLIPLFRDAYPEITFVTPEAVKPERFYASYKMMMFYGDKHRLWNPSEGRSLGLSQSAAALLGVTIDGAAPRLAQDDAARPIEEPYVCIATQATAQAKYWNNPYGWREVIAFLKGAGFRVLCIDQKPVHGAGLVWNHIPHGAEDYSGDQPLVERARLLRHAACFVGLSSGLSWLAWMAGCPVVLISGFTHPINEFATPYRVINWHACNSCWNDARLRFDRSDFLWCPRQKDTPRQFECTRLITAAHVIATLQRVLDDRATRG